MLPNQQPQATETVKTPDLKAVPAHVEIKKLSLTELAAKRAATLRRIDATNAMIAKANETLAELKKEHNDCVDEIVKCVGTEKL